MSRKIILIYKHISIKYCNIPHILHSVISSLINKYWIERSFLKKGRDKHKSTGNWFIYRLTWSVMCNYITAFLLLSYGRLNYLISIIFLIDEKLFPVAKSLAAKR